MQGCNDRGDLWDWAHLNFHTKHVSSDIKNGEWCVIWNLRRRWKLQATTTSNNQLPTQVMDTGQLCINHFSCREGVGAGNYTQTSVPAPKMLLYTDYGRLERKKPSLHDRKFNPSPKLLGTAKAYFVCHIGPNSQISLIYASIACP